MDENKEIIPTEEKTAEKNSKRNIIIACVAVVIVGVLAVLLGGKLFGTSKDAQGVPEKPANPYNEIYVDITGETLQDMADAEGMTLKEYIEEYKLPSDMPGDTNSNAVKNVMPVGIKAKEMAPYYKSMKKYFGVNQNISEFEIYKVMNGMPAEVTEETPYGEAKGMVKLKYIVNDEEELETYKKKYGLGDDVTMETYYKDIRNDVDLVEKKNYEKQQEIQNMIEESGIELPIPVKKK